MERESLAYGRRLPQSADNMNQDRQNKDSDDLRTEYNFSEGVRGKHYQAYQAGTNVVFPEPDIAKVFTDSESVNQALRLLLRLAKEQVSDR